jgi:hypothetical protein
MEQDKTEVVVTDVQIPFWSLVRFLVKLAIASIPACIILVFLALLVQVIFGVFIGGCIGLRPHGMLMR